MIKKRKGKMIRKGKRNLVDRQISGICLVLLVSLLAVGAIYFQEYDFTGHALLEGGYVGENYGDPTGIFSVGTDVYTAVGDKITLSVSVDKDEGFVFQKIYYFDHSTNDWISFLLDGDTFSGSRWIRDGGSGDLAEKSIELDVSGKFINGDNYIVAYACAKDEFGKWRCGCEDEAASSAQCNKWMLHVITVDGLDAPSSIVGDIQSQCVDAACAGGNVCINDVCTAKIPGTGTIEDPIRVYDCSELQAMEGDLGAYYALERDVDCSESIFSPIGQFHNRGTRVGFSGSFEGNGNVISGLSIDNSAGSYGVGTGLFGFVDGGEIRNIGVEDATIIGSGGLGTGILVGKAVNLTLRGVYTTGTVIGEDQVGGIVGFTNFGRLIDFSYSHADVTAIDATAGGVIGAIEDVNVSQIYSTGAVNGVRVLGGLIGEKSNTTVLSSFWDTETSGQSVSAGGDGRTTAEMRDQSTFEAEGWNFGIVWDIISGEYPVLRAFG